MSERTPTAGSPTVVLVHGAYADGSSWNGVIKRLQADEAPEGFADAVLEVGGVR
jgi:hypothetical protein